MLQYHLICELFYLFFANLLLQLVDFCVCEYCIIQIFHLSPAEIERIQKGEAKKEPEKETYLNLFDTKNLKLKERVLIPTKQYPRVSVSDWLCCPRINQVMCLSKLISAWKIMQQFKNAVE